MEEQHDAMDMRCMPMPWAASRSGDALLQPARQLTPISFGAALASLITELMRTAEP